MSVCLCVSTHVHACVRRGCTCPGICACICQYVCGSVHARVPQQAVTESRPPTSNFSPSKGSGRSSGPEKGVVVSTTLLPSALNSLRYSEGWAELGEGGAGAGCCCRGMHTTAAYCSSHHKCSLQAVYFPGWKEWKKWKECCQPLRTYLGG